MKTVVLDVRAPEQAMHDFVAVWAVHSDLTALRKAGIIDRTESGQVEFPYEALEVEFMLQAG